MSQPSASQLSAWHRRRQERVLEHRGAGYEAVLVEAPEHRYGCYVRSSPTSAKAAYVAGVLDWYQYPIGQERLVEAERTNAGYSATTMSERRDDVSKLQLGGHDRMVVSAVKEMRV